MLSQKSALIFFIDFVLFGQNRCGKIAENLSVVIIFPAAYANIIVFGRAVGIYGVIFGECVVYPFAVKIGFKFGVGAPLNVIAVANGIIPCGFDLVCAFNGHG